MKDLDPIFVVKDQNTRHRADFGRSLTEELASINVPTIEAIHLPVDVQWSVEGKPVMGDLKTPKDFIDSYQDGRLYSQVRSMQEAGCWLYFFLIEGEDHDAIVGGDHGWDFDSYDDAVLDIQQYSGVKIVRSRGKPHRARRLAALWRWTGKDRHSSWQSPVPIEAASDFKQGIYFFDETFRGHAGSLMHWPDMGLVTANNLLEKHSYMEVHGITEEGLAIAREKIWLPMKGIGAKKVANWERWIRA